MGIRTQYVEIGESKSRIWRSTTRIFSGSVLSAIIYNVATATQGMTKPNMAKFADDSGADVIDSTETITKAVEKELEDQLQWYTDAGLVAEAKTEILPVKCELDELKVRGQISKPVKEVKFLGIYIKSNNKFTMEMLVW